MAEENKGKSTVSFTEWKIERGNDNLLYCNKYETMTIDGVQGQAERKRQVRVQGPDLSGNDVQMIANFCMRFGFKIAELADGCREADYQRNARDLRADLIQQDKKLSV